MQSYDRRSRHTTGDAIYNVIHDHSDFVRSFSVVPLMIFLAFAWQLEVLANSGIVFLDTTHDIIEGGVHLTTLLILVGNICVPAAQFLHKEKTSEMYETFLRWVSVFFFHNFSSSNLYIIYSVER